MPNLPDKNILYYGDNLPILRDHFPDECVDLIYLDPPFNSNRSYNVLFKDESGTEAESQIVAFDDTWHWNASAEKTFQDLIQNASINVVKMIDAMRGFIGTNQMMAYLVMMAARLVELHRVLKPTGSLYLHCDPTASHYLKIVLDTIFGVENFRNEIIWRRSHPKGHAFTRFATSHDVIFSYCKSINQAKWNPIYRDYDNEIINKQYSLKDNNGRRYQLTSLLNPNPDRPNLTYEFKGVTKVWRWTKERMLGADKAGQIIVPKGGKGVPRYKRYLDEQEGIPVDDFWDDIELVSGSESLGYPTQKPIELLERVIKASSNEGDLVLDPFCGCGTAIAAAQKLNRRWIGIDITHLSVSLMKYRLKDMFEIVEKKDYLVIGEPNDLAAARQLAGDDRYQFQWWALSLIHAKPLGGTGGREGKKGSDKGIDGLMNFIGDEGKIQHVMIQVKSGHVNSGMIRDLHGVVDRDNSAIGVLITLDPPSRDMTTEAVTAGYFTSKTWQKDYPRIQILTIEELLEGKSIEMPPSAYGTFKQAGKVKKTEGTQGELDL